MSKVQMFKWFNVVTLLAVLVLAGYALTGMAAAHSQTDPGRPVKATVEILEFDVAEDMTKFVFDEAPVFEDGLPAHGNTFITEGYIYPKGTLNGSNGVLANGEPEFPDKVLGKWVCRGWFIGDAAHAQTGEWVITTQIYNFGEELGQTTLVTEGYELSDVGKPILRAITGGTGEYSGARGEAAQTFLGFNATEGVNLSFTVEAHKFETQK